MLYIPYIQTFVEVAIGFGISYKNTKYARQRLYCKDFIYSTVFVGKVVVCGVNGLQFRYTVSEIRRTAAKF